MPERSMSSSQSSPRALSVMTRDYTPELGAILLTLSSVGTGFPYNKTIGMQEGSTGITGETDPFLLLRS